MELQDLEKLVRERRTIRQWKKQEVPENLTQEERSNRQSGRLTEETFRDGGLSLSRIGRSS